MGYVPPYPSHRPALHTTSYPSSIIVEPAPMLPLGASTVSIYLFLPWHSFHFILPACYRSLVAHSPPTLIHILFWSRIHLRKSHHRLKDRQRAAVLQASATASTQYRYSKSAVMFTDREERKRQQRSSLFRYMMDGNLKCSEFLLPTSIAAHTALNPFSQPRP